MTKYLRARYTEADLTAAATTQTFTLGLNPAKAKVVSVAYNIRVLATDGVVTVSVANVNVGTAANPDKYIDAVDILVGSGSVGRVVVGTPVATTVLTDDTTGTANNTLEAVPDPAAAPGTATILRDDLVSNALPAIRNNYADLAAKVNELAAIVNGQAPHLVGDGVAHLDHRIGASAETVQVLFTFDVDADTITQMDVEVMIGYESQDDPDA